jgi:lipoyl(octanoyl) transferase
MDLENFFTDIHKYMRLLEEAVIQTLEEFGIKSGRINGLTGVWLDYENEKQARKICALGVKTSRWVTMHGLAFNVNANLNYFANIVPCGIADKAVTSMEKELSAIQDFVLVKTALKKKLVDVFEMEIF